MLISQLAESSNSSKLYDPQVERLPPDKLPEVLEQVNYKTNQRKGKLP